MPQAAIFPLAKKAATKAATTTTITIDYFKIAIYAADTTDPTWEKVS